MNPINFYLVGHLLRAYLDKLIKLLIFVLSSASLFVSHYFPVLFFLACNFTSFFPVSGVSFPVQLLKVPNFSWLTCWEHAVSFSVLHSACWVIHVWIPSL